MKTRIGMCFALGAIGAVHAGCEGPTTEGGTGALQGDHSLTELSVDTPASLPACVPAREGQVAYVRSTKSLVACVRSRWVAITLPPGAQGPAGPPGPAGSIGSQGPTGPQGPQGSKGDTGSTGPAGAQGPKGDTGPAGASGSRILLTPIAAGATCANGGTHVDVGDDRNGNGTLDPDEIQQSADICNGPSGTATSPDAGTPGIGGAGTGGAAGGGGASAGGAANGGTDAGQPSYGFKVVTNGRIIRGDSSPKFPISQDCLDANLPIPGECTSPTDCPYCQCISLGAPLPTPECSLDLGDLTNTCTYGLPPTCAIEFLLQGPGMTYHAHSTPTIEPSTTPMFCEEFIDPDQGPVLNCIFDTFNVKPGTTTFNVMWFKDPPTDP